MTARLPSWPAVHGLWQRNAARAFFTRALVIRARQPIVSFTFDDFPRSAWLAFASLVEWDWKPFATAGYSNFFTITGHNNMANIGGGLNYWYKDHLGIKLEVRDDFSTGTNSANYLVHYYYAYTLSRETMGEARIVSSLPDDSVKEMRKALQRTIELSPNFAEAYRLLGFINLVAVDQTLI